MGWKGTLRTMGAMQRAHHRDSVRRQRDAMRAAAYEAKVDALRAAAEAVEAYENLVERLTSIHQDCGDRWFWEKYEIARAPDAPTRVTHHESLVREELDAFEPLFLDRILFRTDSKRARLEATIEAAINRDDYDFEIAGQAHRDAYESWEQMKRLATRVMALEVDALKLATETIDPFSEITELGSFNSTSCGMVWSLWICS